jgi:uncharacterized membrane protein YbhN (UPF0104 family)
LKLLGHLTAKSSLQRATQSLIDIISHLRSARVLGGSLALGILVFVLLQSAVAVLAVDIAHVQPGFSWVICSLVVFASMIPFSIAGWGVREGAAVALLPLAGLTPEQALAVSILFGALLLVVSLLGGLLWLLTQRRRAQTLGQAPRR